MKVDYVIGKRKRSAREKSVESGDPLLANLRLTDSRETEVGALPSSLGSASSKFEATKYSAAGLLMLLSDPLLANLRLTDSRETEVRGSSFFSWVS
jgi:hypothetical protein